MTDKYIKVKIYNLDAGAQAQAWGNQTTSTPTRPTGIKRQGQGGRVGQRIKGETPPFQFYNYYNVTEDVDQTKEGLKSIKKGEYIFIMKNGFNYKLIRMMNEDDTIIRGIQIVNKDFLTKLIPKLKLVYKNNLVKDYEYKTTATLNVGTTIIKKGARLKINVIKTQDKGPVLYDISVLNQTDKDGISTDTPVQNIPLDNFSFYLTSLAPVHKQPNNKIMYAIGKSYLYCGNLNKFKIYNNIKSLPCIITLTNQTEDTNNEGNKKPIFDLTIKYIDTDGKIKPVKLSQLNMMQIRTFVTELTPELKTTVTTLFQ
jgi:hypothetical protein